VSVSDSQSSRRPALVRRRRALAFAGLAALAFAGGILAGSRGDDGGDAVRAYARAWESGDWAAMRAQVTDEAREQVDAASFGTAHRDALATATALSLRTGQPDEVDGGWRVPVTVRTRVFGTIEGHVDVPVVTGGDEPRIAWTPRLVFPGLREGEQLTRRTTMPERGTLSARAGETLAAGAARVSSLPEVAANVVGRLGPPEGEQAARSRELGYPPSAQVGTGGLERIFDAPLAGRPAGALLAGGRILARARGARGRRVRTTIDAELERAAIAALAGRYGGAVALDPRSGAVLAFAGAPFSLLQPPGSTFKIITAAAALEAGITGTREVFPFETGARLSGVPLANAGGAVCGGDLVDSFAASCNSVFAPLGARLGAERLVRAAERFGFNAPGAFATVAESTIPQPAQIGDDLAVGSTAIGQGRVQATTLQMAEAAAIVANGGIRRPLTLDLSAERGARPGAGERVLSARTARQMRRMMLAVVRGGTGRAAAIPGVEVAGKTGTAELRSREPGDTSDNPEETSAWFVAFAPAKKPRIVVGVLLAGAGHGGDTAAPAAREIIAAALQRG
jgi:cell division protein FtsI/penicillin-binding protein 2